MTINDAHCHFFSHDFFATLAKQRRAEGPADVIRELGWDAPGDADTLARRWVDELDRHGVRRAVLIASVPADETSVARAIAAHPDRFVGFFMLDPSAPDAHERVHRATADMGLRGVCLFPAMHHVSLSDDRTMRVIEAAAAQAGTAVFVHCGALTVGVRKKLGLPSRFDVSLGNPLLVHRLAATFPDVPFVIPHFGAGFLREVLMLADVCPNVYVDTSSSNSWVRYVPGLTLDSVFSQALRVMGASRLLFGTDSSFFPRGWQRAIYDDQKRILDGLNVGVEDQALILGGNFDRLFPAP